MNMIAEQVGGKVEVDLIWQWQAEQKVRSTRSLGKC